MNLEEYNKLISMDARLMTLLKISDFSTDNTSRTLLYGYDATKNIYHTYIRKEKIYLYVYNEKREINFIDEIRNLSQLIPNRRLYPEFCDFEFCKFLRQRGVELYFTSYNETLYGTKNRLVHKGMIWSQNAFGNAKPRRRGGSTEETDDVETDIMEGA